MANTRNMEKIEERKQLKMKMLSTKSPRVQQQVQEAYKSKDKEVKKIAWSDKRSFVEGQAAEAECAAARGELGTVYKISKRLCGNCTNHSAPVKYKVGSTIATEREQADTWVEHFCGVPSHPSQMNPPTSHQRPMTSTLTPDPKQKRKSKTPAKL